MRRINFGTKFFQPGDDVTIRPKSSYINVSSLLLKSIPLYNSTEDNDDNRFKLKTNKNPPLTLTRAGTRFKPNEPGRVARPGRAIFVKDRGPGGSRRRLQGEPFELC